MPTLPPVPPTLADSDLLHLLGEAGDSHPLPADGAALLLDAVEQEARVVPLVRRRSAHLTAAAAVTAVGLVLGVGLFAGDDVDRVGQLAGAASEPRAESGPGPLEATRDDDTTTSSARGTPSTLADTVQRRAAAPAAAPVPAVARAPAAAPPGAVQPADGARVVKRGTIALVVEDGQVTPTLTRVQGFASAAGGLVAGQQSQESGATPSGSVTLRVPVGAFERVVAQVRGLPVEVRSATTSGQDVTAQYADLEAQLRTLSAARARFLVILERADSIGDVLAVQQRVDDVTGRIDRLEGQRRVLAAQSDTAALEVSVSEAGDPAVQAERPDTGLSKAFSDAVTGFATGVEALVRLSGRGLLLVLLAGAAYAAGRLAWRTSRRRLV